MILARWVSTVLVLITSLVPICYWSGQWRAASPPRARAKKVSSGNPLHSRLGGRPRSLARAALRLALPWKNEVTEPLTRTERHATIAKYRGCPTSSFPTIPRSVRKHHSTLRESHRRVE